MRLQFTRNGDVSTVHTDGDRDRMVTAVRYVIDAYKQEPLLVIRGRDLLAVPAAVHYLGMASVTADVQANVLDAVRTDIAQFQKWQAANPTLLKYPDRPSGPHAAAA